MASGGASSSRARIEGRFAEILTPAALDFVAGLQRELGRRARRCSGAAPERQATFDAGGRLDFLAETRGDPRRRRGRSRPRPDDLERRWVELTGPAERKMVINALNSGARASSWRTSRTRTRPTWRNMVQGQVNLARRGRRARSSTGTRTAGSTGSTRRIATLLVRPRGWHLPERHCWVDGEAGVREACSTSGSTSSTTAGGCSSAGAGPTSTSRSSRATSRRGSGTTRSSSPRAGSGSRRARSARTVLDRDDPGRVRDGRDPVGAAGPLGRAQRGPLGLHVQPDQEVPDAARRSSCRTARR